MSFVLAAVILVGSPVIAAAQTSSPQIAAERIRINPPGKIWTRAPGRLQSVGPQKSTQANLFHLRFGCGAKIERVQKANSRNQTTPKRLANELRDLIAVRA